MGGGFGPFCFSFLFFCFLFFSFLFFSFLFFSFLFFSFLFFSFLFFSFLFFMILSETYLEKPMFHFFNCPRFKLFYFLGCIAFLVSREDKEKFNSTYFYIPGVVIAGRRGCTMVGCFVHF